MGYNTTIQCIVITILEGINVDWINSDGNSITSNNTLVISNVMPTDHDTVYTCTAVVDTNPENCDTKNRTIVLKVKGN